MNKLNKKIKLRSFYVQLQDYFFIAFGIIVYAIGFNAFILPEKFVMGGVSGIASLLFYAFALPPGVMIWIINALLLVIAFRAMSREFVVRTIVGVTLMAVFVEIFGWFFSIFPIITLGEDRFMHLAIGSMMIGAGLGIVFAHNGSTGGTDVIVALINKHSTMSIGRALQLVDLLIICSSYVLFQSVEVIVYGVVYTLIASASLDYVVNGTRQTVQFFIISKRYELIADAINKEMQRGVTIINGEGWYSKKNIKIVMVLSRKYESQHLFNIVKSLDPNALISQSFCHGVFGEGFDRIK